MPLERADVAEVIRSSQKDEYYISSLKGRINFIAQSIIGPYFWIRCQRELELACDLVYYLLTTVSGYQTLGEEYVNIIQVVNGEVKGSKSRPPQIPNTWRRAALIMCHCLMPYIINRLIQRLNTHINNRESEDTPLVTGGNELIIRDVLVSLDKFITWTYRLHRVVFYFTHVYYHIAKHITHIRYVKYGGRQPGMENTGRVYRMLGTVAAAHLITVTVNGIYNMIYRVSERGSSSGGEEHQEKVSSDTSVPAGPAGGDDNGSRWSERCVLCLEPMHHVTSTPCGHLYCYTCIYTWAQNKLECPTCRQSFDITRLVYLVNYKPSHT